MPAHSDKPVTVSMENTARGTTDKEKLKIDEDHGMGDGFGFDRCFQERKSMQEIAEKWYVAPMMEKRLEFVLTPKAGRIASRHRGLLDLPVELVELIFEACKIGKSHSIETYVEYRAACLGLTCPKLYSQFKNWHPDPIDLWSLSIYVTYLTSMRIKYLLKTSLVLNIALPSRLGLLFFFSRTFTVMEPPRMMSRRILIKDT